MLQMQKGEFQNPDRSQVTTQQAMFGSTRIERACAASKDWSSHVVSSTSGQVRKVAHLHSKEGRLNFKYLCCQKVPPPRVERYSLVGACCFHEFPGARAKQIPKQTGAFT